MIEVSLSGEVENCFIDGSLFLLDRFMALELVIATVEIRHYRCYHDVFFYYCSLIKVDIYESHVIRKPVFSSPEPKAHSPEPKAHKVSLQYSSRAVVRASVHPSTLSNTNIFATSQPIAIKFYLKHHPADLNFYRNIVGRTLCFC